MASTSKPPSASKPEEGMSRAVLEALARSMIAARARLQWSQGELARAAGTSQQHISQIEAASVTGLKVETVAKIARALETDVSTLLSG